LLVEDDAQFASQLHAWFTNEGHLLEVTGTGEDAMQLLGGFQFEVLLLDWTLPGASGLDVCKHYRAAGGLGSVIFLTGRGDINDKEQALDYGADDYVTKPFDARELSARVRSVLRRPHSLNSDRLSVRGLVLDLQLKTITVGDASQQLMRREATILEHFILHPNKVYSSQELVKVLASPDQDMTAETVRSWMRNLRAKLDAVGKSDLIRTIPKAGYVLDCDS